MNTNQLEDILSNNCITKKYFTGVYSINTLKNIKVKPRLVICNTDPSYKTGKHWVLFFFYNNTVDYFDSLGKKPEYYGKEFITFMKSYATKYNLCLNRIQPKDSSICGHYCVWFAIMRSRNYNMYEIINSLPTPSKIVEYVNNCLLNFKSKCNGQHCINN